MTLTYFYAQLFGLIMLLVGLAMVSNRRAMLQMVRELLENRALLFMLGLLSLFVGLVVVLTHNGWTGGALSVIVTLVGWLLILRAILLFFLPHGSLRKLFSIVAFEQTYYFIALVILVLGIFLTYHGFGGY